MGRIIYVVGIQAVHIRHAVQIWQNANGDHESKHVYRYEDCRQDTENNYESRRNILGYVDFNHGNLKAARPV